MSPNFPAPLPLIPPCILECFPALIPRHGLNSVQEYKAQSEPEGGVDQEIHCVPGALVVEVGGGAGVGGYEYCYAHVTNVGVGWGGGAKSEATRKGLLGLRRVEK